MNMALRQAEVKAGTSLSVFAFFHLNLAFSSIEEERRGEVIERCYWPLLKLADSAGPLGLEISGYTLEEVAARDPAWIAAACAAITAGRIELIGSGYSQMIGPLVPARVIAENLRLGMETYERLLGVRPRIALVNEQAYAGGLVGQYLDAGFEALIMDFDNPSAAHPEWDAETAYLPHHAAGPDGRKIALLWSNTIAFQQMQRLAHGDTDIETYAAFVRGRHGASSRALCLYASDAEIFDFRPGRFKTEERLSGREWPRIEQALRRVTEDGAVLMAPSDVLGLMHLPGAGRTLVLESAAVPVPVKKQRKYNLARWAVTGRDNTAVNAACQRIFEGMTASATPDWRELCYLWASDFRTHLTEKRWTAFRARLQAAEAKWSTSRPALPQAPTTPPREERHLDIITPTLSATLDRRRGLALASLHFAPHAAPAIGGLPHGFFDDIALQADWYTGDCVFEAPGEHKLTDLDWCEARIARQDNGDVIAHAVLDTARGRVEKQMRFCADRPRVEFDLVFHWSDTESGLGKGVLRLGHFTLLPEAFDLPALALATCNGGGTERFALAGHAIEHGAPVSFLVSSSHGLGMTEGWLDIGDGRTNLRIEVDRATAPLLGLVTHRPARRAGGAASLFCQIQLSALELDDTRKPGAYADGPRRFRFAISAV